MLKNRSKNMEPKLAYIYKLNEYIIDDEEEEEFN